jgi:uncharacterized membrane protein
MTKTNPAKTKAAKPRAWPRIVRIVRSRPRLFIATAIGVAVALAAPMGERIASRMIVGWDVGVALYLVLALVVFANADPARIKRYAAEQDEGAVAILVLTAGAALASLAAIVFELVMAGKSGRDAAHLGLALATIALSWAFTHVMFALHYAHEFYARNRHKGGGLHFPGEGEPDYWDFLYFSLVIGMTSQVSDVAVAAKSIRRTVTAHGVVAFVFNTTLLALAVNIAASAL